MKVGDTVLVPVKVVEMSGGDTIRVEHNNCGSDFWVVDSEIQTITTEDYHNALNVFTEMDYEERKDAWGFSCYESALDVTVEDFVSKLRKYQSEPKTGQIWKTSSNQKVVVLKASGNEVHYYRPCGHTSFVSRNYFGDNFINTGEVLTSIDAFLKDLEGLNEKG